MTPDDARLTFADRGINPTAVQLPLLSSSRGSNEHAEMLAPGAILIFFNPE